MSNTQQVVNTSDSLFVDQCVQTMKSFIPVTIVYTEDPYDTAHLIRASAKSLKNLNKVQFWNIRTQWVDVTDESRSITELVANHTPPNAVDPKTQNFELPIRAKDKGHSIYVMSLASKMLEDNRMPIIQTILDIRAFFSSENTERNKSVFILADAGFKIPPELERNLYYLDHKTPNSEYLKFYFESTSIPTMRQSMENPNLDPELLKKLMGDFNASVATYGEYVSNLLTGFTLQEFDNVVRKAFVAGVQRDTSQKIIGYNGEAFKESILKAKKELVRRTNALEFLEPIPMNEIGGMENLKEWLQMQSFCMTQEARDMGVDSPKGMCLIGPPGSGKSYVAKATSGLLNVPCLKLDINAMFDSKVGGTEAKVKQALSIVEEMSPCVLFIDEVDKAFASQATGGYQGDSGVTMRLLGTILTFMQESKGVFLVVTANHAHNIPTEFLRKGRLDEIWCVTYPNKSERSQILSIHLKKRKQELKSLDRVVAATDKYSSSELEQIVKDSVQIAFFQKSPVTEDILIEAAKKMKPMAITHADSINAMIEWAETNARWVSKDDANSNFSVGVEL